MPNKSNAMYQLMIWTYKIQDSFGKPGDILLQFGIKTGYTVIDYGCGPGRYLKKASELVGKSGRVYGADVHPLAIQNVRKLIQSQNLNVTPVLLGKEDQSLEEHSADLVYALDMFHQVADPLEFLAKIYRIIKKEGFLYLEDGHQSREATRKKISQSKLWQITDETKTFVRLKPLRKE
ncbi:MAG TPA: methyltransferase type 11 [Firmicutes bacterium]|jgi:ubiquinone/menaquinone biosynthesis C-methylase UbiE|nr:methyltransferase type 11 [Bacillota bacterium]